MISALFATMAYCVVGSNPGSQENDALHVLECDTLTGRAKIVQTVRGVRGTTYFQMKDGKIWTSIAEKREGRNLSAAVVFSLQGNRIGKMERLVALDCETPCHVELGPDGEPSFASYVSGTYSKVLPATSALPRRVISGVLPGDAPGPRKDRQKKAYAHQTFYTPDGKYMGVCDLGCDKVLFFDWRSGTGLEKSVMTIHCDPGDGPRHAIFSKDGKYLFVLNELSSSVTSYLFEGKSFKKICKLSTVPEGVVPESTKAAAIKLTGDGKILMASNRGLDSIAFFEVCGDGTLVFRNREALTGSFPRDFELMPGEKFMVVGLKMSNEIQVYAFDRENCSLKKTGAPIPCFKPLCFKFI
jgi:6-phosphogluconolactonase